MHLMIDIETGSTQIDATIFSIAAVGFNPQIGEVLPRTSFYEEFDHRQNRHTSPETMAWWADQPIPPPVSTTPLIEGLNRFLAWLPPADAIWANSPSFDLCILKNACAQYDLSWPYPFWCERDVRTIKAITFPGRNLGNLHHAYKDAVNQALFICDAYKELSLRHAPQPNIWSYQPNDRQPRNP